ncbi:hypothetical protein SG34_032090 [Thalassomonas viridans]|uniref:Uncharacterized protein n=1 Tax=Thalassomonas viridans TaxID=137584 RepID=A0AAF0CDG1_9GAMM|nr:hypothetical protein [Thalassomonas viridans]WDE08565.1 hypothetical protein SG34_032090 [Thalassomonas viridans]
MNNSLIQKVVGIVRQKLKEQENLPGHSHKTIEQILNESGICGLGPQPMAEFRAEIYHALGLGLCQPGTLKESLQGFILDYDVFSVSELRYYFPGDKEAELFSHLTELGYVLKTLVGEPEPVWRPKGMQRHTIQRKLKARKRIGSPEYLAYLSYKPPQRKDTTVRH